MRFSASVVALVASAAVSVANTITVWSLDETVRTLSFTPNPGSPEVPSVTISSSENTTVTFPENWAGNGYAIPEGESYTRTSLLEVSFTSYGDVSFFDVSMINNFSDVNSVMQMWPVKSQLPWSGCLHYPCNTAYWQPDDVQTQSTTETDFIVTIGGQQSPIVPNLPAM